MTEERVVLEGGCCHFVGADWKLPRANDNHAGSAIQRVSLSESACAS